MQYKTILDLIGNTPIIELKNIESKYNINSLLIAKVESFNPSGSIKVRIAKQMIESALKTNLITQKTTIIEPTSGNTGIGLSFICACLNMKFIAVMPENMSQERQQLIKLYGGDIVLTDAKLGMKGSVDKAIELKEKLNGFIPSQFENPNNPLAHYLTTAEEIYNQTNGDIDYIIMGIGTGGTITGISSYLKNKIDVKIVGVEPASSPLLTKGFASSHKIPGIGANFKPDILDLSLIDEIITVNDEDALTMTKELCNVEGLFVGISSGAVVHAALKLAQHVNNKKILVVLPDSGDRYFSMVM